MRKWRKNEEMDREICAYAQNRERAETVSERVTEKMEALAKQLKRDLKYGIFYIYRRGRGEREFPFPTIPGNTSLPFPFPKFGNEFFIPVPVPKSWECYFPFPFPFPKFGNAIFHSRTR